MPSINPTAISSSARKITQSPDIHSQEQDVWFDAVDHVEMDENWFDTCSYPASTGETADSLIPFTEDCRRGIQQLIRTLGEYEENRILSACLSKILPGAPASLVMAASSLYSAITEQRNIDTATLHALGLASWCLPDNINLVSQLAVFIRDTVTAWTDETFLQQFLGCEENQAFSPLFIALAITSMVAGRWMTDNGAPQRGLLKIPAFVANIFIRASHYWNALGNMTRRDLPPSEEARESSQRVPAFEVETSLEMTRDACNDPPVSCLPSEPRITAFSSNSTALPDAYTRATVTNRPSVPRDSYAPPAPEQAHALTVDKLRQQNGLSELLNCDTRKIETRQQTNEKIITNTYFNTKCDAIAYPGSLSETAMNSDVRAVTQEKHVSSAAGGRGGDVLLPLVAAAVTAPVATSYLQAWKSKTVIAAGSIVGLTGLAGIGKILWDSVRSHIGGKVNNGNSTFPEATVPAEVEIISAYDKLKPHERAQQSIPGDSNNTEIMSKAGSSVDNDATITESADLFSGLQNYIDGNQIYKSLDDYDLISCYLAENNIEQLKDDEQNRYPSLEKFSLDKVAVIVNENIKNGINFQIYTMVATNKVPRELIPYIEQKGNTADEIKFHDTYHRYKEALAGYADGMKSKIPSILSQIRLAAEELYATHKSDQSYFSRREELRVQLYHLNKMCEDKMSVEFRPLFVSSVAVDGFYYPPYEETFAGRLLESVVQSLQHIPESDSVSYGAAYQARKSILAYSLHIMGINSLESFNLSELNRKDTNGERIMSYQDIYEYLMDKMANFTSIPGNSILQEVAQHYHYSLSLTTGLTLNSGLYFNINDNVTKSLGDFTLREKEQSLKHYLNKEIEIKPKRKNTALDKLLTLLALNDLVSDVLSMRSLMRTTTRRKIKSPSVKRTIDNNNIRSRAKGVDEKIKKPRASDFKNKQDYTEALNKYRAAYKQRYNTYSGKTEIQIRTEIAKAKMTALDKIRPVNVIEEAHGPFNVFTAANDRAKTLVLSSHGWYTPHSNDLSLNAIPRGKKIIFLGPNKEKLLEAPQVYGKSATESLFIPGRYPEIYTQVTSNSIEVLNTKRPTNNIDSVKNYSIKHYEKTPDIEYNTAVKDNRIYSSEGAKVDFAMVNPLAGEKKLRDVIKLTKPGQPLEGYDNIIFYACREYKVPGVLTPALGGGYEITFTDIPLSKQKRHVRDTSSNPPPSPSDAVSFDGLFITDKYTVKIDKQSGTTLPGFRYTVNVAGVTPYENDSSPE